MNKALLLFALSVLFFTFQSKAQTIPNSSFEKWDSLAGVAAPTGWTTSDQYYLLGSGGLFATHTVTKDPVAHTGKYGMKVAADQITFAGKTTFFPGFATVNDSTHKKPRYLIGYYKGNLASKDSAAVAVSFSKWNKDSLKSFTVGGGDTLILFPTKSTTYKLFALSMHYTPGMTPDSFTIFVAVTSKNKDTLGNITVDDLKFSDSIPVINTRIEDRPSPISQVNFYPVPASNTLYLDLNLKASTAATVIMSDLTGREVAKLYDGMLTEGRRQLNFDVSTLSAGTYLCRIQTGIEVSVYKIVITH